MNENNTVNVIKSIPSIQNIGEMVGANPFVDCAESLDFFKVIENNALEHEILPSFEQFSNYYKQGLIDCNTLHRFITEIHTTLSSQEVTILHGLSLQLLNNTLTAQALDASMTKKAPVLVANIIKEILAYDLPNTIQEQIAKIVLNYKDGNNIYDEWKKLHSTYNKNWDALLTELPVEVTAAKEFLLTKIGVKNHDFYCKHILIQLSGWIGYLKSSHSLTDKDINELVLIWLANEYFYIKHGLQNISLLHDTMTEIHERHQKAQLLNVADLLSMCHLEIDATETAFNISVISLKKALLCSVEDAHRIFPQHYLSHQNATSVRSSEDIWLFCMDPRSEHVRHTIEQSFKDETYGCAGFFNIPLEVQNDTATKKYYPGEQLDTIQHAVSPGFFRSLMTTLSHALDNQRKRVSSAFQHYELFGLLYLMRSFVKSANVKQFTGESYNQIEPDGKTRKMLLAQCAHGLFKSIGLCKITADRVNIVSHSSHVENNHYHSTLQCAACHGNAGAYNSVILSNFLNDPDNRKIVRQLGIEIADETVFVPLLHNTAKDEITALDVESIVITYKSQLKIKLQSINEQLSLYNHPNLPKLNKRASSSWSKLVPEFGLCGHTSLVIGPRSLTEDKRLDTQAFLHSYDHTIDNTGDILASILSGPAFVAHQLNMQYFFSTAANDVYSSGDKIRHSIIPNVGVLEADSFELKFGLPKQSFMYQNKELHIPTRLRIYVYAPQEIINKALSKSKTIRELVNNNWIHLEQLH